jgi:drug/metabolite transporter, DME family
VPRALRAFARCRLRDQLAVIVIGVGASAVATALFTKAFALAAQSGDYITPLVLQKLQPVVAVLLAVLLLHERLRASYAVFALPALAGAWLLAFPQPFHVQVQQAEVASLALGAAVLWATGTVLGRLVSFSLEANDITTLRFLFGLVGAIAVVEIMDAPYAPGWHNAVGLILLALIPGLLALRLYYRGLTRTPASRATLAELAFPATAAVVGVVFLNSPLDGSQWTGFAVLVLAVLGLGLHEHWRRPSVVPASEPRETADAAATSGS